MCVVGAVCGCGRALVLLLLDCRRTRAARERAREAGRGGRPCDGAGGGVVGAAAHEDARVCARRVAHVRGAGRGAELVERAGLCGAGGALHTHARTHAHARARWAPTVM